MKGEQSTLSPQFPDSRTPQFPNTHIVNFPPISGTNPWKEEISEVILGILALLSWGGCQYPVAHLLKMITLMIGRRDRVWLQTSTSYFRDI